MAYFEYNNSIIPSSVTNYSVLNNDWEKVISLDVVKNQRARSFSYALGSGDNGSGDSPLPEVTPELEERDKKTFPTKSIYTGQWDPVGMSGFGSFTMPHGVVYQGEMKDGRFHGIGSLRYPMGSRLFGHWVKGNLRKRLYRFNDNLEYKEKDWKYCEMPDRRFRIETLEGLQPAGRSNKTQRLPTRQIPPGCFDTGDGFYSPKTKCLYSPDTGNVIRIPTRAEEEWIMKWCRRAVDENSGFRPDLYENWHDPQFNNVYKCVSDNTVVNDSTSTSTVFSEAFSKINVSDMIPC